MDASDSTCPITRTRDLKRGPSTFSVFWKSARNQGDLSPASEPVLLNGAGGRLAEASLDNPTFLEFDIYETADFSEFNITL